MAAAPTDIARSCLPRQVRRSRQPCHLPEESAVGRARMTSSQIAATTVGTDSCSQNLSTFQPAPRRQVLVSRSRSKFVLILIDQYSAFRLKPARPCSGHPCQKQPSMKTATRAFVNTMSARRRIVSSGAIPTRYLRPRRCNSRRTAISGPVSRERLACMLRRRPGLDAQDSAAVRRAMAQG